MRVAQCLCLLALMGNCMPWQQEQRQQQPVSVCFRPFSNCLVPLIYEIGNASKSIDIFAYSFTLDSITEALVAAHKRNVSISMISDRSNAATKMGRKQLQILATLARIRFACRVQIQHSKIMIFDNRTVLTGSINFSKQGFSRNSENMLVLRCEKVARLYSDYFDKSWSMSIPYSNVTRPCA